MKKFSVLKKKELIRKIITIKNYVSARDIYLTIVVLYPSESKYFKSPIEIGKLLETMPDVKFIKNSTSPKLYFI